MRGLEHKSITAASAKEHEQGHTGAFLLCPKEEKEQQKKCQQRRAAKRKRRSVMKGRA